MKTPEEIKKGLEAPIDIHYHDDPEPRLTPRVLAELRWLHDDALAYIQQLEANDSQVKKDMQDYGFQTFEELLQAYSQVKRERDAAVRDIKKSCVTCRYYEVTHNGYDCNYQGACDNIYSAWEWRGVPEPPEGCNDERR